MASNGPVMTRGGRPAKPDEERLTEVINFRTTKATADALCRGAIRARMSVNQYVRDLVSRALVSVGAKPREGPES